MKDMKKILFIQLPHPVKQALTEHLAVLTDFDIAVHEKGRLDPLKDDPDLIVSGIPLTVPGCPVLALSFGATHRLGNLLREIGRMIAQPVLYIDDMPLGAYIFKPQERLLARDGGADVPLTDREVDILAYLIRHRAMPVSRETLLKNVWQYQEGVDTHTLETHIYRLRQKIEDSAESPQLLRTVEGGYALYLQEVAS